MKIVERESERARERERGREGDRERQRGRVAACVMLVHAGLYMFEIIFEISPLGLNKNLFKTK